MKIICSGAGPAGLYFCLLLKKNFPDWNISLYEKSDSRQTTGWGIILNQGLLKRMSEFDPTSFDSIKTHMINWDNIHIKTPFSNFCSEEYSFLSISRQKLISILQTRCENLGVNMIYNSKFSLDEVNQTNYDLLVVSEGLNSKNRQIFDTQMQTNAKLGSNKYIWLGMEGDLGSCFNFLFVKTYAGYIWAHNYKFEDGLSTFVVEMKEQTWLALGFDTLSSIESMEYCQSLFADYLKDRKLLLGDNYRKASFWQNYTEINCESWSSGNMVLLGNTAHNTHFSIGSGTRLAIEDAMVLAQNIMENNQINPQVLQQYESARKSETSDLHQYSRNSMEWFEDISETLIENDPELFAKQLLNRAGKIRETQLSQ